MRVVVVDNLLLVRKGIVALLSNEQDMEVVGEAASFKEAVEVIISKKPDLVLMDSTLGRESGIELIDLVHREGIEARFIILASEPRDKDFRKAYDIGAEGYLLKEALPEELFYVMRLVEKGRKYYDPSMMEQLMKEAGSNPVEDLTPRELDVLIALGGGLNNNLIAKKLYITEFTVKKHISQILAKLNLSDRTQAALYANSRGLVKRLV